MARMITVKAIYTAPVKSLALQQPERVHVGIRGIAGDRRFYLVNEQGKLLTQRQLGKLVQVKAGYSINTESLDPGSLEPGLLDQGLLRLTFPNGDTCQGPVTRGRGIVTVIWDRRVKGHLIEGIWDGALSEFCGEPVQMVASNDAGQAFDEFPVSIVSVASLQRLTQEATGQATGQAPGQATGQAPGQATGQTTFQGTFTGARFRPNFLLEGCHPHEEDTWLNGAIQVGDELRLQPIMPDPRCSIVTQNPATGQRDVDTLRLIRSYRPSPGNAYFGVYAIVENPGAVSVGDEVKVLRTSG